MPLILIVYVLNVAQLIAAPLDAKKGPNHHAVDSTDVCAQLLVEGQDTPLSRLVQRSVLQQDLTLDDVADWIRDPYPQKISYRNAPQAQVNATRKALDKVVAQTSQEDWAATQVALRVWIERQKNDSEKSKVAREETASLFNPQEIALPEFIQSLKNNNYAKVGIDDHGNLKIAIEDWYPPKSVTGHWSRLANRLSGRNIVIRQFILPAGSKEWNELEPLFLSEIHDFYFHNGNLEIVKLAPNQSFVDAFTKGLADFYDPPNFQRLSLRLILGDRRSELKRLKSSDGRTLAIFGSEGRYSLFDLKTFESVFDFWIDVKPKAFLKTQRERSLSFKANTQQFTSIT